jgi:predicted nucleic acid-binding protein
VKALTFDTGALIAVSRGDKRMRAVLVAAQERRAVITVPAVVVAEWWRLDSRRSRLILGRVDVESVSEHLAKIAGEAIAAVPGATAVDAIVMASAAQRGDAVFTSDIDDLDRLRRYFPGVRLIRA